MDRKAKQGKTYNAPEGSWHFKTPGKIRHYAIWVNADKRALATRIARWKGCQEYGMSHFQGKLYQVGLLVPWRRYEQACRLLGLQLCADYRRLRAQWGAAGQKSRDLHPEIAPPGASKSKTNIKRREGEESLGLGVE